MPCIPTLSLGGIVVGFNEFENILVSIYCDNQWHEDTPPAKFFLAL